MPSALAETLQAVRRVDVLLGGAPVGTLARSARGTTVFSYTSAWLAGGFSVSPFSLPLREGLFETTSDMPDGLFGVFRDSLPDDWGRLLQDRKLAELGVQAGALTSLARLTLVGSNGLGALEYQPSHPLDTKQDISRDWDLLSAQCKAIMDGDATEWLDGIYARGSSSGGARPKVMVEIEGEPWIVKFPANADGPDAGWEEYELARRARACGIVVPPAKLIPSSTCKGYFASKRFDRRAGKDGTYRKIHMASAAALLEVSPFDVLDYRDLMRLTFQLTHDANDCERLFRIMCFNVAFGNCDDHARNFSYLYEGGAWHLSPAYDLTRDAGFLGEHATLVNGKGDGILATDLLAVGAVGGVSARKARAIVRQTAEVAGA